MDFLQLLTIQLTRGDFLPRPPCASLHAGSILTILQKPAPNCIIRGGFQSSARTGSYSCNCPLNSLDVSSSIGTLRNSETTYKAWFLYYVLEIIAGMVPSVSFFSQIPGKHNYLMSGTDLVCLKEKTFNESFYPFHCSISTPFLLPFWSRRTINVVDDGQFLNHITIKKCCLLSSRNDYAKHRGWYQKGLQSDLAEKGKILSYFFYSQWKFEHMT